MLARAVALVGLDSRQVPRGGTFHAVAHRYLATNAESLGLAPSFGVLDPAEASDLMDLLRGQYNLVGSAGRYPRSTTLVEIYSRCITSRRPWPSRQRDTLGHILELRLGRRSSTREDLGGMDNVELVHKHAASY
jgi:superfamily I DNA/RNA helicase